MATKIVKCPSCNTENTGLENFCRNCGNTLGDPFQNSQESQPMQATTPVTPAGQAYVAGYPSQLSTLSILQLIFGILEVIFGLIWGIYVLVIGIVTLGIGLLLVFIPFIFLAVGICSIVSASQGMKKQPSYGLSLGVSIAQICLILMCDIISCVGGIVGLVIMLNDEVKGYFNK